MSRTGCSKEARGGELCKRATPLPLRISAQPITGRMDPFTSGPPPSGKPLFVAQPNSMSSSMSTASSHPLAHTLASLRTQLAQVQRAAHTQGMQLQGRVLEATMAREGREAAEREMQDMRREMEVLRWAAIAVWCGYVQG